MPLSVNAAEYKSRIGLDSLYIAEVTEDSATAYTVDTPEYFAPAAEASQEPTTSFEVQYADDNPYDVMTAEGETKITLQVTNVPVAMLAKITGKEYDAATGRMYDNNGTAPYIALSFRSKKSNGSYRYYQYLKGMFEMPKESQVTQGEAPEPQTVELIYTAIRTIYQFDVGSFNDNVKRVIGDEDATNFDATGWFTTVQQPSVGTPSALALSSSTPTDGVTGVSLTANQTLTFNNALVPNAIYMVSLIAAATGSVIAGTISLDATKKIVTIDPTASLGDTVAYIIAYNVEDIYGQHLSGAVNFESASA
jgi:phi13 family phage major tail protein